MGNIRLKPLDVHWIGFAQLFRRLTTGFKNRSTGKKISSENILFTFDWARDSRSDLELLGIRRTYMAVLSLIAWSRSRINECKGFNYLIIIKWNQIRVFLEETLANIASCYSNLMLLIFTECCKASGQCHTRFATRCIFITDFFSLNVRKSAHVTSRKHLKEKTYGQYSRRCVFTMVFFALDTCMVFALYPCKWKNDGFVLLSVVDFLCELFL